MKCEIDVDLGELANEWEPVAFRVPTDVDMWVNHIGQVVGGADGYSSPHLRLIVRRKWTPPAWLKPGWIAMDADCAWFAYRSEPEACYGDGEWRSGDEASHLCPDIIDFTPPPCDDWKQSKRRIN